MLTISGLSLTLQPGELIARRTVKQQHILKGVLPPAPDLPSPSPRKNPPQR